MLGLHVDEREVVGTLQERGSAPPKQRINHPFNCERLVGCFRDLRDVFENADRSANKAFAFDGGEKLPVFVFLTAIPMFEEPARSLV